MGVIKLVAMISIKINGVMAGSIMPRSKPFCAQTSATSALAIIPRPIRTESIVEYLHALAVNEQPINLPAIPARINSTPNKIMSGDIAENFVVSPTFAKNTGEKNI